MENPILVVDRLVKKYDRFLLNEISFSLPKGYIMGFVGQNGAGKSTTLKCIMNLIEYNSGKIEVFGLDNRQHSDNIRNRIGYVSEEQYFYEDMTVNWTGEFFGGFYKEWECNYFKTLLSKFDIDGNKKVKELSKGMKMKLSLIIALAHKPELLILDEPTSGLDPVVRSELLDMFLEILQDENCSILFSSHITQDIEKVADFVTVIDNGRIIMSEDKDRIMNEWKIVKADNTCYREDLYKKLIGVKKGDFAFSGATNNVNIFTKEFRRLFPGSSFKTEKITLDELLIRLVKEGGNQC